MKREDVVRILEAEYRAVCECKDCQDCLVARTKHLNYLADRIMETLPKQEFDREKVIAAVTKRMGVGTYTNSGIATQVADDLCGPEKQEGWHWVKDVWLCDGEDKAVLLALSTSSIAACPPRKPTALERAVFKNAWRMYEDLLPVLDGGSIGEFASEIIADIRREAGAG